MRKDMEGLIHSVPTPQAQPQTSTPQQGHHPEVPAATSTTPTADPKIATEPPPQSKDIPAGGLLVEKRAETSSLPKQEDRVAHAESALTSIMQQNALVQQLLEENRSLKKQQLALCQFQNIQIERSHPHVQHSRLKQAASCIARLSRDKQQLIEMCNRLRAQTTTAGLQEPAEPEKDSPTEKQGEQHDRLSALEQLQYQLTTQVQYLLQLSSLPCTFLDELQYALRQRLCAVSEANNPGPATRGTANPWSQGHTTTDKPENSRNKENTPPPSRPQSSVDLGLQPCTGVPRSLLSSEESLRSLKELWEKLDQALSPSLLSEGTGELSRREEAQSGGAGVQMAVHGVSAPMHIQPQTEAQQRMNPSKPSPHGTKTSRAGAPGKMSKIRNYNHIMLWEMMNSSNLKKSDELSWRRHHQGPAL
ncbi:hypothetical protein INR49_028354 [Caranx melampygus]|nr:hypothetical protein INR49_028354 [Caranx melampygus]